MAASLTLTSRPSSSPSTVSPFPPLLRSSKMQSKFSEVFWGEYLSKIVHPISQALCRKFDKKKTCCLLPDSTLIFESTLLSLFQVRFLPRCELHVIPAVRVQLWLETFQTPALLPLQLLQCGLKGSQMNPMCQIIYPLTIVALKLAPEAKQILPRPIKLAALKRLSVKVRSK